jgi:DNA-binding MarR family transcriptional regulator
MSQDSVDELLAAWKATRPELDPSPLGVIGRVLILAEYLQKSVEAALAEHHLTLGQFDILATLRRHAPRGGLTPGQLLQSVILSSGAMTSRLDKLERAELIHRRSDPTDRRGVIVELTGKGKRLIDQATRTRFAEAESSLPPLSPDERRTLEDYLRRWILALKPQA